MRRLKNITLVDKNNNNAPLIRGQNGGKLVIEDEQ
jgi:hypothetical protein